ncbi:venom serine protease-like isoform X2 [Daktulosphaira vitifoliae]|uniref:venom serine protease-like isoform X2 n=1 Tax=Daktulosphaira vitifoliae TaxID=58002 RepID=UPI0021AA7EFF|nr:venom serine protease-like isoform X2 [Daktulosphaira vitifoliae]
MISYEDLSPFCDTDVMILSRTGDESFVDGVRRCGPKSFTVVSRSNKISILFRSKFNSKGGKFVCSLAARISKHTKQIQKEVAINSSACDCGKRNKPLTQDQDLNGGTTGVNEFPLMASLIDSRTANLFCGATIISKHHALTAAHCLNFANPYQIGLLVGDHDVTKGNDTDSARLLVVTEIYMHPFFNMSSRTHDLAIVETHEVIPFSSKVGPACLPFRYIDKDFVGETVEVLGWGTINFGGPISDTLQKTFLKVVPISRCTSHYKYAADRDHMCTFFPKTDSCQVDSGGPLIWTDPSNGKLTIVGVISFGVACIDKSPSVNTKLTVPIHLFWIRSVIAGQRFCS